jgi:hypothetical protein
MNITMSNLAPLQEAEVREMVNAWYEALDVHAAQVDFIWMVSDEELEMRFPEATLRSVQEFERWYQGVIRIFFDEVHTMQSLDVKVSPDGSYADVKLVVRWEASKWSPPARYSDRLKMDAYQTWKVKRSAKTGKPCVTLYIVDKLDPLPGSAPL